MGIEWSNINLCRAKHILGNNHIEPRRLNKLVKQGKQGRRRYYISGPVIKTVLTFNHKNGIQWRG